MGFFRWLQAPLKKESGAIAENLAASYLKSQNYQIIEKNFTCKLGEIDIIAVENNKLVFVEVKYRKSSTKYGGAKAAVNRGKQKKLILTAKWYLKTRYSNGNDLPACRFDVVTLEGNLKAPQIELFRNAFIT